MPCSKLIPGFSKYLIYESGAIWSLRTKKFLAQGTHKGYLCAKLVDDFGNPRKVEVHTLLLLAFKGPKPFSEAQGRHLNDNKLDNTVSNLAWGTQSDNARDSIRNGVKPIGEDHFNCKVSDEQALSIACRLDKGERPSDLAREFGITSQRVGQLGLKRRSCLEPQNALS